jgi:ADYC domain
VQGPHIDESLIEQNSVASNGPSLPPNGPDLNGILLFSLPPNGISLNNLTFNGISLNSLPPNGISANGMPINVAVMGPPLSGADLVGSTWTGNLSDGTTAALRIDAAMQLTGANSDMWSYRWSVSADGAWQPLCVARDGHAEFADATSGTWNLAQGVPGGGAYHPETSEFTIACRGSAIAKCLELGYKPWDGFEREIAACTRAMRADYCGIGTPFTVSGIIINIFDDVGIQPDAVDWVPEAEWGPDGAQCVSNKKQTRFYQVVHETPPCFPHALKPKNSCGTEFSEGAAIITELAPQ